MRVGRNYLKYLKTGCNRKEGRGNKDFKKGGKLGQGMDALKRGAGTSLQTHIIYKVIDIIKLGMFKIVNSLIQ